jgi:hypothetical protein
MIEGSIGNLKTRRIVTALKSNDRWRTGGGGSLNSEHIAQVGRFVRDNTFISDR